MTSYVQNNAGKSGHNSSSVRDLPPPSSTLTVPILPFRLLLTVPVSAACVIGNSLAPSPSPVTSIRKLVADIVQGLVHTVLLHRTTGEVRAIDCVALDTNDLVNDGPASLSYPKGVIYSRCDFPYHDDIEEKATKFSAHFVNKYYSDVSFRRDGIATVILEFQHLVSSSSWFGLWSSPKYKPWERWEFQFKLLDDDGDPFQALFKTANTMRKALREIGTKMCTIPCAPDDCPKNFQTAEYVHLDDKFNRAMPFLHEISFEIGNVKEQSKAGPILRKLNM